MHGKLNSYDTTVLLTSSQDCNYERAQFFLREPSCFFMDLHLSYWYILFQVQI